MKTQSVHPMFWQKRIQNTQGKRGRKGKKAWWNLEMLRFGQFQSLNLCLGAFTFTTRSSCERVLQRERGWHCNVCMKRESRQSKCHLLWTPSFCLFRWMFFKLPFVFVSSLRVGSCVELLDQWQSSSQEACQSFVDKLKAQNPTLFLFFLAGHHHHDKYQYQFLFLFCFLSLLSLSPSLFVVLNVQRMPGRKESPHHQNDPTFTFSFEFGSQFLGL